LFNYLKSNMMKKTRILIVLIAIAITINLFFIDRQGKNNSRLSLYSIKTASAWDLSEESMIPWIDFYFPDGRFSGGYVDSKDLYNMGADWDVANGAFDFWRKDANDPLAQWEHVYIDEYNCYRGGNMECDWVAWMN